MSFITDQQTIDDLQLIGRNNANSIYTLFNRTCTGGGAALLENMFRHPLADADEINRRCQLIACLSQKGPFPFSNEHLDIAELYLNNRDARTMLSAEGKGMAQRLGNLIAEHPELRFVQTGVDALLSIIHSLRSFTTMMTAEQAPFYRQELAFFTQLLSDPVITSLPDKKEKLPHGTLAALDLHLRFERHKLLKDMLRHIYHVDVYMAVGRVAKERNFVFPIAAAHGPHNITVQGLYHPHLKNAVTNDIGMSPQQNVIFLTGANMAGKSTFMKSLAIAVYLAHMGFPVAAASMTFSIMDGMYTTINLPDNLGIGASHFYSEVLRLKKVAKALQTKKLFVLFLKHFLVAIIWTRDNKN